MTMGELAQLFNIEMNINHKNLHVIKLVFNKNENARLPFTYENARWLLPSPNLPTLLSSLYYPGTVIFEALDNVSLGRGTTVPFQVLGAPYFDNLKIITNVKQKIASDQRIAKYFNGIKLIPIYFIPQASIHVGKQCVGVQLVAIHPEAFNSTQSLPFSLTLLSALLDLYSPQQLGISAQGMNIHFGNDKVYQALLKKVSVPDIVEEWKSEINSFKLRRAKYLIYP